ncbi:MAG TPA: hypothetical protein VK176_13760 [Phycisphaerales bacterium]|nr:hypothetical protein [Phycisphaerales bacterium]
MKAGLGSIPIIATAAVLLSAMLYGAAAYPNFASFGVARNLLVDNAVLGVAAVGATFVILAGGIDLSIGSVMAFTSILIARLIEKSGVHPLAAFSIALAAGTLFGFAQGSLIRIFRLPAFLVTLAGMFLARGAAFWVHPESLGIVHEFVAGTLNTQLTFRLPLGPRGVSIPLTVDIFIMSVLGAGYILRCTRAGRAVYAIGDDEHAAQLMGIAVGKVRAGVYAVSGFFSALAGVVLVLYQQSGNPASCTGYELDAIAAVVIGGTLLRGGVGSIYGTVMGVLILGLIQTLLSFHAQTHAATGGGLSSWWTRIAIGGLMLLFVVIQRLVERLAGKSR